MDLITAIIPCSSDPDKLVAEIRQTEPLVTETRVEQVKLLILRLKQKLSQREHQNVYLFKVTGNRPCVYTSRHPVFLPSMRSHQVIFLCKGTFWDYISSWKLLTHIGYPRCWSPFPDCIVIPCSLIHSLLNHFNEQKRIKLCDHVLNVVSQYAPTLNNVLDRYWCYTNQFVRNTLFSFRVIYFNSVNIIYYILSISIFCVVPIKHILIHKHLPSLEVEC